MPIEFKLPDVGEGIAEGEIVKWLVKVGDVVKEHQAIVEVMTDKATVEVPAPAAGKITAIKAKEGQTVPVGSVIFSLETAGAPAQQTSSHAPASREAAQSAQGQNAQTQSTQAKSAPAQTSARQPAMSGATASNGSSSTASHAPSVSRA